MIGDMLMQACPTLTKGIGNLVSAGYTAESAVAQADSQRAAATGKAISGIRSSVDGVVQGAQNMFGQVGNSVAQSLQYVIALSQAH